MTSMLETLLETKVIRRRWKVRYWIGVDVRALFDVLSKVPPEAKIVDVDEDDEGRREIIFECEQEAT